MATARIPMVKKLKTLPSGPTVPPVSHLAPCKDAFDRRSEEHTSELQSLTNLVCRLLLETKKHTSELQLLTNLVCRLLHLQKGLNARVRTLPTCQRSRLGVQSRRHIHARVTNSSSCTRIS